MVTLSGQSQAPAAAKQLQGQQLRGGLWCHCAGALPHGLVWHQCDTSVAPVWHRCALSLSQAPVTPAQAEVDHGTEAAFSPRVFATGTRRFEVAWFSLVVPQGSRLPNKCWRLKQVLNYQLILNVGTSAIISWRQRKLWSEFGVLSSFYLKEFCLTWKFLSFSYLANVKCTCSLCET